jgi:hypothetical protein
MIINVWVGKRVTLAAFVESHPFTQNAKGWGTRQLVRGWGEK